MLSARKARLFLVKMWVLLIKRLNLSRSRGRPRCSSRSKRLHDFSSGRNFCQKTELFMECPQSRFGKSVWTEASRILQKQMLIQHLLGNVSRWFYAHYSSIRGVCWGGKGGGICISPRAHCRLWPLAEARPISRSLKRSS